MGSKKHKKRERSSSSSASDSSISSSDSRHKKEARTSKHSLEDSSKTKTTRNKKHHRAQRASSGESVTSKQEQKSYKRSRSRSYERRGRYRERSRSKDNFTREADRVKISGYSRNSRRSNKRNDPRNDRYDSRDGHFDRRKNFPSKGRRDRDNRDRKRSHYRSRSRSFDHANAKWGKNESSNANDNKKDIQDREKPNFALSGKLTEETNTYRGIVIKYSEPPEARKPRRRWRLYPFKGEKALQTLYIHRESAYLIGRERKVVDLPVDHPSCSKQHAALQYRLVPFTRDNGTAGKRVRPYLIDLESANGTFINNKKIESRKYVELLERDVIKFGFSSREYVLLHENSKDEAMDDDVKIDDEEVKAEVDVKEEGN